MEFPELFDSQSLLWRHTVSVVLTFESVDENLWRDNSNQTSSAVLLHDTICLSIFCEKKIGIFLELLFLTLLGVF